MDDPWFIAYRGRGKLQITPTNVRGWTALIAMTLASLVPMFAIMPRVKATPMLIIAPLVILAVMWILFVRWALTKSEVINIDDLLAERRARKRSGK
ncbi:hypothetical protein [Sphingomonas sp.]|uniref:hypothetical protein n=1 Tax=Sphingomonas sp. TaxID=28214 RepID=UPI00333E4D66